MLTTQEEKKSLLITIGLFLALFLLLFFFGLSYLDPATEQGIAVNFGTSETGSGKIQPTKTVKTAPTTATSSQETPTPTQTSNSTPATTQEELITQNSETAPVIESTPEKQKTKTVTTKEVTQKNTETSTDSKPKPKEKKPDTSTQNALNSFLNGDKQNGETTQGEGNDSKAGDKGKIDGDPNAKAYYGTGKGLDGDGNYRLGGRKALNKEKKIPTCNETGIVVVKIIVNQAGKVIKAYPGIKGTTNTAPCLMQPAKLAALNTLFNSDNSAPSKQIGSIVYEFKLSE